MFLRDLGRKEVRKAIKSCERRMREIKKECPKDAKEKNRNEWVKITVLMMRLEHPPIENTYSLVCPTCQEEWNYTNNDTHRFRCCPNCGRWFKKKAGGKI